MSVNGLSTKLSEKENSENKTAVIREAAQADDEHYPTELAVRTGLDAAGRFDTVNGIEPDTDKNVQTDYVYATEADFEADKANIPAGATVIKLYEYPDNLAGYMVVPDYVNTVTTNRLSTAGWTVPTAGFLKICLRISKSTNSAVVNINVFINNVSVLNLYNNGADVYMSDTDTLFPVKAGDILRYTTDNTTAQLNAIYAYFVPPLFIKKELPIIVEKNGSYSLDEIKTADTWIDGKPIYRKMIPVTLPLTSISNFDDFSFPNIMSIIRQECIMYRSDINVWCGSPQLFIGAGNTTFQENVRGYVSAAIAATDTVRVCKGAYTSWLYGQPAYSIIWYTKKTD
jgi:hypothetical protein